MESEGASFLALAELLYEAALQRIGWEQALERIAGATGASGAVLLGVQAQSARIAFEVAYRMEPGEFASRGLRMASGDPSGFNDVLFAYDRLRPGDTAPEPEEIAQWLRERGGHTCYIGARMFVAPGEPAILVLDCSEGVELSSFQRFQRLAPHIERALQISHRLAALDLHSGAIGDTIELLPFGVFLIDSEQKVCFANRTAHETLAMQDGLELRDERLHALEPLADSKLTDLIRQACTPQEAEDDPPGGGLLLERPSGKRPYSILVSPLDTDEQLVFGSGSPAVVVFVTDPERRERVPDDLLRGIYGLTPAEARLACLLAAGLTLDEAARELGTARGTVRVHLERVFRKTGTNRQPDLIRLLLTSPALLKPAND